MSADRVELSGVEEGRYCIVPNGAIRALLQLMELCLLYQVGCLREQRPPIAHDPSDVVLVEVTEDDEVHLVDTDAGCGQRIRQHSGHGSPSRGGTVGGADS